MHLGQFAWLALLLVSGFTRAQIRYAFPNPYEDLPEYIPNRYDFTANLSSLLVNETKTWAISPIGFNSLLHLLYLGATGPAKLEVLKAMHWKPSGWAFSNSDDELPSYMSRLKSISEVNSSNALVVLTDCFKPTSELVTKFENQNATIFARIESEASIHSPEVENLDQWIKDASGGNIQEINLPPSTTAALINVVHLKFAWGFKFQEKRVLGTFNNKEIEMMKVASYFNVYDGDEFFAIRLPFEGEKLSAIIVVSYDPSNPRLNLDSEKLNFLRTKVFSFWTEQLILTMPSFQIKAHRDYSPSQLKLPELSGVELANFGFEATGCAAAIGKVSQQVFIKVDEAGSKTKSPDGLGASLKLSSTPFTVDKSFHYLIVANPETHMDYDIPMEVLFEAFVTEVDEKKPF